eukprot:SAG11_NODE_10980_length_792_cov_0.911977_1_plen_42_part_10
MCSKSVKMDTHCASVVYNAETRKPSCDYNPEKHGVRLFLSFC